MRLQTFAVPELFKSSFRNPVVKNLEVLLSSAVGWELNWHTQSGGCRSSYPDLSGWREAWRLALPSLKIQSPESHGLHLELVPRDRRRALWEGAYLLSILKSPSPDLLFLSTNSKGWPGEMEPVKITSNLSTSVKIKFFQTESLIF